MKQTVDSVRKSVLAFAILLAGTPCLAQSQDTGASAPAAAKPATNSGADANATPAAANKKKPKKVWTNDSVSSIPGGVSVVGGASQSDSSTVARKEGSPGADEVRQKQIDGYRDQIKQMRAQMEAADKRIAQLKNFKGENTGPSGGISLNQGYNMVPVDDQVKQLEARKKQLEAKIEDVENEARKNGIDSGDLR